MGYLIKAIPTEIITAKVTLTSANLLTPNFVLNIPEYPPIDDYFWNVIYVNGEIVNGSTPYTGSSAIHIQSASSTSMLFRFAGSYMNNGIGTWLNMVSNTSGLTQFVVADRLQIHNPGTLTLGDTELNIYIGATLIKY
jgi:hypothetical protein